MFCCCTGDDAKEVGQIQVSSTEYMAEDPISTSAVVSLQDEQRLVNITPVQVEKVEEPVKLEAVEPQPREVVTTEYTVSITKAREDSPVGLELDTVGGACALVMKITSGAIMRFNETAPPENQVKVGDFVVGVNGVTGDTKGMAQQTMHSLKLELLLRRPSEFGITLDKLGKTGPEAMLGIDLDYLATGKSLLIRGIKQGLVKAWSETNPDRVVCQSDRIVGVNGFRGDSEVMLKMCKDDPVLELILARA